MAGADAGAGPRVYLIAPARFGAGDPDRVARLLDGFDAACVRLALPAASEDEVARAADALRPVCHARDVPLVVADHFRLAPRLGLDGVHLPRAVGQVHAVEPELFAWWSEMIEVPVVAEGALTPALVTTLEGTADFLAVGPEIWEAEDPAGALRELIAPLG